MTSKITFKSLEKELKKRENYQEICDAYEYALKMHEGMKRLTGDDLIAHVLEVTKILLDLNVDDTTIIASLLHEVINNGTSSYEEIKDKFGLDVANIVESVSKINKLELPNKDESSAYYLRKILIGLTEDVRSLYIKLADRLHNMRTNWAVSKEKQKEKAEETMDVLVPIAHRLGINSIKSELENLSLYYLKPDVYNDILEKLNDTVSNLNGYLEEMKDALIDILTNANIKFKIKGRVKSVYSIYNKLNNGKKWDQIYDILALRIFVDKESDCYQVIGLIHANFRPMPKRFKDYIANPKENMYQSLHTTVFGVEGKIFEIQIRTYEMDEIAEKGIASHWSYKEKGAKKVQNIMEQKLELFRNVIESGNKEEDNDFEDAVNSEIFSDSIYVYTPNGDCLELPKGSTPIDFAYRIHSNIGDKTVGALVNDQIVPLNTLLNNDDIISIKTNPNASPNKDWLNFVKTTQAKKKIKAYFSKQDREEYINRGKDILEKELRKRKLSFNTLFSNEALKKIITDLKLTDLDDIYLSIGSLRYTAGYIINLVNEEKPEVIDAGLVKNNNSNSKTNYKGTILVEGAKDILVNIAKCCLPIKGDEIVGYITKGDGITIHKKSCSNIDLESDRIINVSWNYDSNNYFQTNIYVMVNANKNIMAEIITEIGKKDSIVLSCNTLNKDDKTIYAMNIKVKDNKMLDTIINTVEKMNNVISVSKDMESL